ncbi:hypothetical protein NC652_004956 [Populus alba x Populus x berolinensis]|nr:hypothetical protein NC652_004956 [Populus alba x Populus x berolinensis]
MSTKALRTEAEWKAKGLKISRNRVIDSYLDSDSDDFYQQKNAMKDREAAKMDPGSGVASSSVKPFLRRRFTFGSKWSRTLSEKKGFGQGMAKIDLTSLSCPLRKCWRCDYHVGLKERAVIQLRP